QDRHEVPHDVLERARDAEEVGIEAVLAHSEPELTVDSGREVVFGHRLDRRLRLRRIPDDIDGFRRDADLVHLLPGPFEIRPARRDDAYLRIPIALLLLRRERVVVIDLLEPSGKP